MNQEESRICSIIERLHVVVFGSAKIAITLCSVFPLRVATEGYYRVAATSIDGAEAALDKLERLKKLITPRVVQRWFAEWSETTFVTRSSAPSDGIYRRFAEDYQPAGGVLMKIDFPLVETRADGRWAEMCVKYGEQAITPEQQASVKATVFRQLRAAGFTDEEIVTRFPVMTRADNFLCAEKHRRVAEEILEERVCNSCGADGARKKCAGCLFTRYCDEQCQTRNWPKHKTVCSKIKCVAQLIADQANGGRSIDAWVEQNGERSIEAWVE